jgi:hypothetical protein
VDPCHYTVLLLQARARQAAAVESARHHEGRPAPCNPDTVWCVSASNGVLMSCCCCCCCRPGPGRLLLMKVPNIIKVEPHPYNPDTTEVEPELVVEGGKKRLRPNDINVIRWRYRWVNGQMYEHRRVVGSGACVEGGGRGGGRQEATATQRHQRHPLALQVGQRTVYGHRRHMRRWWVVVRVLRGEGWKEARSGCQPTTSKSFAGATGGSQRTCCVCVCVNACINSCAAA